MVFYEETGVLLKSVSFELLTCNLHSPVLRERRWRIPEEETKSDSFCLDFTVSAANVICKLCRSVCC